MVKLIKQTLSLFSVKQDNIISAASVIMIAVLFSRILGLIRDWLLVTRFTPQELGVYLAAFRIPDMIFELLVMGSLSTAFIPVFTAHLEIKGKNEAFKVAAKVINIGLVIFALFSLPLFIFTRRISMIMAPGFNKEQIDLMVSFTRIMILAQVFPLIIGNFLTGILQSFKNFLIPSLAPVAYNIGIILGILIFTPMIGLYAPVVGVVFGAFFFVIIQIPLIISSGYKHSFSFDYHDPGTREIGRLMLPRTIGLAISQIDTTIDLTMSTLLGAASVTAFNYAQNLQQLPIGLFGASIAQATLPTLSSFHAQKNFPAFKKIFISSFHQILFFVVPLSSMLIVLRLPIVRLVYGVRSLLDIDTTVNIGKTLAFFSISLFAQSLVHLLARSFYALHDSKTPVFVGAFSVILNTALSIMFITFYHYQVWALGLSTSIASILNMVLLLIFLDKKVGAFGRIELFFPAFKIFLAGLVTGVALYIPIKLFDQLVFDTTRTINLLMLTGISAFMGLSVYFFLAWFLEVPQTSALINIFKKAKRGGKAVFLDTTQEVVNAPEMKV